jgi:hypothetical protein
MSKYTLFFDKLTFIDDFFAFISIYLQGDFFIFVIVLLKKTFCTQFYINKYIIYESL